MTGEPITPELANLVPAEIRRVLEEAAREHYDAGILKGFETTLRIILGESELAVEPFPGELAEDQERWARDALARLTEEVVR